MTTPYTYLLYHKPTATIYYGVRWAKGCYPGEFWVNYFTSSKLVKALRDQYGDDSFEFEIRRTFKTGKVAAKWESTVLRRMKVLENTDIWLNRTTNTAWLYDVHPRGMLGKKQTTPNQQAGWNKDLTGIYTEETKYAMGATNRGKSPINKSKKGLQKHTDEWKRQKSLAMLGNTFRRDSRP